MFTADLPPIAGPDIEYALIAPILIALYFGIAEFGQGMMSGNKAGQVASSTGDLAPDGVEVMSYRSNVPAIAEFTFRHRDPDFRKRLKDWGSGLIVAGDNYGQGSSR